MIQLVTRTLRSTGGVSCSAQASSRSRNLSSTQAGLPLRTCPDAVADLVWAVRLDGAAAAGLGVAEPFGDGRRVEHEIFLFGSSGTARLEVALHPVPFDPGAPTGVTPAVCELPWRFAVGEGLQVSAGQCAVPAEDIADGVQLRLGERGVDRRTVAALLL